MQQSAAGAPTITANATIAAGSNVKPPSAVATPSSLDHRTGNTMKDVDVIHFTSSQQSTVTTTAAPVITVVSSTQPPSDMISTQPVAVQVSSSNPFIAVSSENGNDPNGPPAPPMKLEEADETPHANFEDYGSVYSNGSSSTGQMTYYVTDSYSQTYYHATVSAQSCSGELLCSTPYRSQEQGVHLGSDAYLVMDQPASSEPSINAAAIAAGNCALPHRETNQNVIVDEDYSKTYQQSRMSVQPQTVTWLVQNYETADGVSLPRSTLYSHYQQHCQQNNIEPVNAASFGKLIRSVFVGLRTRRLGTRGNSKYHYYGIRIKAGSTLSNDGNNSNMENSTMPPVKRAKVNNVPNGKGSMGELNHLHSPSSAASKEALMLYLGDASLLDSVWPSNQVAEVQDDSQKLINTFIKNYRAHYDKIIKALSELNFHEIEVIWHTFWQAPNSNEDPDHLNTECIKGLTKSNFATWIVQTDYTMYNSIISNLLLPNLLKPIPQNLTQQIRNFAKCINKWMNNALQGYEDEFIRMKTSAVSALSHMLRRYTSLNHLSTAACSVLKNQQQVAQMISDLNKVDFKNVQEQASCVCQCDDELVSRVEHSFKNFLQDINPHERWSLWCQQVLDMCLPDNNIGANRQFFYKWVFYSSLVMRDLTLRSAQSFGSFHLIRLLYDEYIFYLIEQRIAKETGTTPLQMLGELASNSTITHPTGKTSNNKLTDSISQIIS